MNFEWVPAVTPILAAVVLFYGSLPAWADWPIAVFAMAGGAKTLWDWVVVPLYRRRTRSDADKLQTFAAENKGFTVFESSLADLAVNTGLSKTRTRRALLMLREEDAAEIGREDRTWRIY